MAVEFEQFFDKLGQAGLALNQQQQVAVATLRGPLMVIAGPGSGKTRVITARTAALLHFGVSPDQILVLTFTKAAAREMKARLMGLSLLPQQQVRTVNMSTFHALCFQILKAQRGQAPRLATERQRRRWVEQALLHQQEEIKDDLVEEMLQQISFNKNSNQELASLRRENTLIASVWADYEAAKTEAGLLDFEDLLLATLGLLAQYPELLRSLQRRWQFIMVDEFQDTNLVQYELLRMLAAPTNHICVVGDIDQAIYAWRAADPELLLRFPQDFPGGQNVELVQNYRSLPPIINLANQLIAHNQLRHKIAVQPVRQGDTAPRLLRPSDEWAEAKAVLTMLQKWQDGQTPLNELAVLYRVNSQARPLVSLLVEAGFPFVLREKGQLGLEHWVLQECHAFLRLLSNPNDMESFLRVGRRQLGLNAEGGEYLQRLAQDRQLTPYAAYRQLPIRYTDMSKLNQLQQHLVRARKLLPSEALNYYLDRMGFGSYLEWYAAQRGYPSDQFLSICDDLLADLRRFTSTAAYLKHVDNMLSAVKQQENAQQMPGINLMTLHSAKGLEFKAVWILGVTDGLLPHRLSKSAAQLEEERRLFYVGCTRAKDYLYLLAPNAYHDQTTDDSPFLVEAFGQALKARPQQPKQTQAQWSATKVSGNRTTTPEQIAPGLSRQPPPAIGQTIKHKDLGVGEVVSCVQEKTRGQTFHVLTIDFPHRADFKLHWELSLEMGFVERSD
ncbi:MAG TPA: hypothetical protein DDZ53_11550 [Firmicutes bacterium]|nr:hypothetical protein [Bacillota bacterium]